MKTISNYIEELKKTLNNIDISEIDIIAKAFNKARKNGNHIYVFGNGGSGSTASHMVCDFLKGSSYKKDDKFKILCLNDNIPTILAYSNDVSYDEVFVEQLKNYLKPNDLVIGISGSGNSKNIIKAIDYANKNNGITIGFTGFDGGKLKKASKYSINAMVNDMQISEDIHVICMHILYKIFNN
jgi:D-sedoheptulose 7-phosphate isomerase